MYAGPKQPSLALITNKVVHSSYASKNTIQFTAQMYCVLNSNLSRICSFISLNYSDFCAPRGLKVSGAVVTMRNKYYDKKSYWYK